MTPDTMVRPMTRNGRPAVLAIAYYGVLLVAMTTILTDTLGLVLPADLARRIGFNSEGYVLALVLGAYLQFGLPRLRGSVRWTIALLAAGISLAIALGLFTTDLPSRFKTLNEAFFALAVVLPYVTLTRPLHRWPVLASAAMLAAIVFGVVTSPGESVVVLLAETFAVLVLTPLAFDIVDRGILDAAARTSAGLRYCWYAGLILIPVVVVLLGNDARTGGGFGEVLEYVGRTHEAVLGLLLVQLYFAVALRRTGRPTGSGR